MFLLDLILICLIVAFGMTCIFYKSRRERIEQTCIKESPVKTFLDEFITNAIIVLPIGLALIVLNAILGAFE